MSAVFIRRGCFEIIQEIISLCNSLPQKTHILYKCNLSFEQLQKYLEFLVVSDLLQPFKGAGKDFYRVTEKGREFVKEYKRLNQLLSGGMRLRL